jgi:hypothetical protein
MLILNPRAEKRRQREESARLEAEKEIVANTVLPTLDRSESWSSIKIEDEPESGDGVVAAESKV